MDDQLHRFYQFLKAGMRKKPFLSFISIFVLGCHLFFVIHAYVKPMPTISPQRQKLVVHTKVLPAETPKQKLATQEKIALTTPQVVKKVATAAKPSTKTSKPLAKTPKAKTSQPVTKPLEASKTKKLLGELQESIAKIETNRDNISVASTISVPTPIKELKADSYEIKADVVAEESVIYRDMLIHHLKDSLHLPGYGTVKIALTLSHEGVVQNMDIIFSDSEINRLYLENALTDLMFPPFSGELANKKNYKFCLTFCSDS